MPLFLVSFLQQHVAQYLALLSDAASCGKHNHHARMLELEAAGSLSLGVEIVWKTHMLRPCLYAQACSTSMQVRRYTSTEVTECLYSATGIPVTLVWLLAIVAFYCETLTKEGGV